ncbi:MAG TPA: hypothetical protein VLN58_16210 [Verrucomicrobiae bacterium]|nr:hypothetical protein [Verrucomicrobiae bacterium]
MRMAKWKHGFEAGSAEGSLIVENNNGAETVHVARTEYLAVYSALRKLLKPYEDDLAVRTDKPGQCYLETRSAGHSGRRLFFAAAKIKKKYVSYYLPVLYMFPELSSTISPGLRKTMQGQSCFNFTEIHPENLQELEKMTRASFLALKSKALL